MHAKGYRMRLANSGLLWLYLLSSLWLSECALIKHQVLRQTGAFINSSMDKIYQEGDLQLAERFLGSNLKLIEILAQEDSSNRTLNLLAAQAFGAYAMAFIEDQDPERAHQFYLRGLTYAFRALPNRLQFGPDITPHDLEKLLKKYRLRDVPALFWLGYNWGQSILQTLDQPASVAGLAKVELIMRRVLELDENYNFAGVHLFYATYYTARPPLLGGNLTKGKEHFDRQLALTHHRFNLSKYYYARYYAVQMQDLALFDSLLTEVIDADLDAYPAIRLFNALAKQKALQLLKQRDIYFDLEFKPEGE